jgi:hypothetical protein
VCVPSSSLSSCRFADQKAYFYTFRSSQSVASLTSDTDAMTLLASAVAAALNEVSPYQNADGTAFVQSGNSPSTSVEVGFTIIDKSSGSSVQSDLTSLFNGNANTLAVFARKLVEAITNSPTAATSGALDLLYTGLSIISSDGGDPVSTTIGNSIVASEWL